MTLLLILSQVVFFSSSSRLFGALFCGLAFPLNLLAFFPILSPSSRLQMSEAFLWVSAYFTHPFRRNDVVQAYWKEERQQRVWELVSPPAVSLMLPCLGRGQGRLRCPSSRHGVSCSWWYRVLRLRHQMCWLGLGLIIRQQPRLASTFGFEPPPPDSRMPSTPPVSLPPGFRSPSASDADSTFAGFRSFDCPLRLRVEDAFSCYREDDSDWVDAWCVQLSCLVSRHATLVAHL